MPTYPYTETREYSLIRHDSATHDVLYAEVERAQRLRDLALKRAFEYADRYCVYPYRSNKASWLFHLADCWDRYCKAVYAWYCDAIGRHQIVWQSITHNAQYSTSASMPTEPDPPMGHPFPKFRLD